MRSRARAGLPRYLAASASFLALSYAMPVSALVMQRTLFDYTQGRFAVFGSFTIENEKNDYAREIDVDGTRRKETEQRDILREKLDVNARGFVWDPRFLTVDVGVTVVAEGGDVSREDSSRGDTARGETSYDTVGYRLNTIWLGERPHPLNIYANSSTSTVAAPYAPSYELSSTNLGVRGGLESKWLGDTRLFYEHTHSESDSGEVPRDDVSQTLGMEAKRNVRAGQWGSSDLTYGYIRTDWSDEAYGGAQHQNHFYLYDRTQLGDKANLIANLVYYNRDDSWGGDAGERLASDFFNLNSALTVQQSERLRYSVNAGLSESAVADARAGSYSLSAGLNYRISPRWLANALMSRSASSSDGASSSDTALSQLGGGIQYNGQWGGLVVNGGYGLGLEWQEGDYVVEGGTLAHTLNLGYSRRGNPIFLDMFDIRMTWKEGDYSGEEGNVRYGVNSQPSPRDMIQALIEYREFRQDNIYYDPLHPDDPLSRYQSSTSGRFDLGWLHQFDQATGLNASYGATRSRNRDREEAPEIELDSTYYQFRLNAQLLSNLRWTASAREERITGLESQTGQRLDFESELLYRIGKWQAGARYRLRDARMRISPFREESMWFYLRRNFNVQF